jgi:hypothetical protein
MSLQSNFLTVPVPWQLEAELLSGTGPDGALVVQQKTFIDATKVFFQYPEDDCGPMSAWYHPLVHQYSSDPILEHAELRQFACHTCMPLWGYVFWDYETLSVFGHQPLISIDEMLRAARGISVDSDKLFQDLWNRSHLGYDFCECPIHRQADGCLPVNGW